MVAEDMKVLGLEIDMEQLQCIPKSTFKEMVKNKIQLKAFIYLTELKNSHSKTKLIKHEKLELQGYLQSGRNNLTIKEKQFIFAARTRMLDLKGNFKIGKTEILCRKCDSSDETQEHLMECPALIDQSLVVNPVNYQSLYGDDPTSIGRILLSKLLKLKLPCAPTMSAATAV